MTSWGCEGSAHLSWGRWPEQTQSGTYCRALRTQAGCIPALRVPTLRRGHRQLVWQTIPRSVRCWGPRRDQALLGACGGLSRRALQGTMPWTLGEVLSPGGGSAKHRAAPSGALASKRPRPASWWTACRSRAPLQLGTSRWRPKGASGPPSAPRNVSSDVALAIRVRATAFCPPWNQA